MHESCQNGEEEEEEREDEGKEDIRLDPYGKQMHVSDDNDEDEDEEDFQGQRFIHSAF